MFSKSGYSKNLLKDRRLFQNLFARTQGLYNAAK